MGKKGANKKAPNLTSGSQASITLREESSGKKQPNVNGKSMLKLEHLQNLTVWASGEASIPSLGAFLGHQLATLGESLGSSPNPSLFPCQRYEGATGNKEVKKVDEIASPAITTDDPVIDSPAPATPSANKRKRKSWTSLKEIAESSEHGKRELQLNGRLFKVRCCGDIVSRMVQVAYKAINNTIDNVRELCSFGKPLPLWYLTSAQHKDALELESGGEFSSQDVWDNYEVPSAEEWEKVRSICELVDRIYEVTGALFESKYPTANAYLYHLRELQAILIRKSTSTDRFIQRVARKMLKKFDKYWKDIFLFQNLMIVTESQEFQLFWRPLAAFSTTMSSNFLKETNISSDSTSSSELEEEDIEEDSYKNVEEEHRSLDDRYKLLPDYIQFIQSTQAPQPESELDWYFEEPVLPWTHEFNALSWWRNASSKYPTLSRMARDRLAIPVSIANSYEAFCTEPREADERIISSGSGPDMMNALMCTRSCFVARGTVVLAEFTEFTGNFTSIASQCLQKLPSSNNKFTYNCDGHTFNYLVEDGFTYCVVAVESAGRQIPMAFLERVKEDFTKRYGGGKAATTAANSLNREFGPKLKEQIQYCVDHPEEISKLSKVKAQVSEVKGVMMENIEKVLDRGEKIELLVDKTENLRSQAQDFRTQGTQMRRKMWLQNMKIKLIVIE
ncbi:unnamed protein product [Camellia sinensis]